MKDELLVIADLTDQPGGVDGKHLFGIFRIPFRTVKELARGAVREFDLRSHTVRVSLPPARRPCRLRKHPDGVGFKDETKIIQEMARLSQHAPAALGEVRIPMLRVELARIDPEAGRFRTGTGGERLFELQTCGG